MKPDLYQNLHSRPEGSSSRLVKILEAVELLLVIVLIACVYCSNIQAVPFHPDESQWISTSFYFEALFSRSVRLPAWTNLDPSFASQPGDAWVENYWTLTQPPMARYFIALGRLSGGYGVADLNMPWQFDLDMERNLALGAMPSSGLLWWSRLPMALLAVASGLCLFILLREIAGRAAGYTFLILFVTTPYFLIVLRHAMGEAALVFFAALATWIGVRALAAGDRIRHGQPNQATRRSLRPPFLWLVLMGAVSGLAGASKLNGLAVALAGILIALAIAHTCRGVLGFPQRRAFATWITVILLLAAWAVFVAVNPYLYPNPVRRTALMALFRNHEIAHQQVLYPASVFPDFLARVLVEARRVFQDYPALHFRGALPLNLLLFGLGAGYLCLAAGQWLRGRGGKPEGVAVLAVACVTAVPALFTPLDWDRYYVFPILFVTICASIAVGMIVNAGLKRLRPAAAGLKVGTGWEDQDRLDGGTPGQSLNFAREDRIGDGRME